MSRTTVRTAVDRQLNALPIVSPNFAQGQKLVALTGGAAVATPDPLPAGAYLLSVGPAPLYVSIGSDAADAAGSIYLGAGVLYHVDVPEADFLSVIAAGADDASIFIVPLQ